MKDNPKVRKIAFVGDYLPRKCGIATFTSDLLGAVSAAHPQSRCLAVSVNDIEEVRIRVSPRAMMTMADGPEKWAPRNRETADHSIPYTASVALLYGTIDESYFEEKHFLHNQELLQFISRIKCSAWDEATMAAAQSNAWNLCEVEIVTRSGQRSLEKWEFHRGHWRNPMTDAEIEEKFHKLNGGLLPQEKVEHLLKQLWNVDTLPNVGTLIEATLI